MMNKEWYARNFVVALVLTSSFLFLPGCGKSGSESDGKSTKIKELSKQITPLQIRRSGENIETVTLNQAMAWHETHEHEHEHEHGDDSPEAATQDSPSPLCLGVSTGYQAIRYAVDELFPEGVPEVSDFNIKVSGPMDGVWDVMSLYTGKELKFDGEPQEMGLKSFIFTARRISQDKSLVFCLKQGLIPEEFFTLKNQGATCDNPALGKMKQQALLNILSAEPEDCFEAVENAEQYQGAAD